MNFCIYVVRVISPYLFSAIPLVGDGLKTWILGDYTVGNATLNRFFALHYVLPFVILGVVGLHVVAVHVHGSNNPAGIDIKSKGDTVSFFPYMIVKDTLAVCVCGVVISVIIFFGPNLMAEVDNYIPANPMVTPAHIVPNWYLAPFYAILRAVPDKLGGVALMFSAILIVFDQGNTNNISIAENISATPPSLSGTARRIA
jgi:ubiquinol-cytochrome c reductase cytochrome b subunit